MIKAHKLILPILCVACLLILPVISSSDASEGANIKEIRDEVGYLGSGYNLLTGNGFNSYNVSTYQPMLKSTTGLKYDIRPSDRIVTSHSDVVYSYEELVKALSGQYGQKISASAEIPIDWGVFLSVTARDAFHFSGSYDTSKTTSSLYYYYYLKSLQGYASLYNVDKLWGTADDSPLDDDFKHDLLYLNAQDLFNKYGTHMITNYQMGGYIEITANLATTDKTVDYSGDYSRDASASASLRTILDKINGNESLGAARENSIKLSGMYSKDNSTATSNYSWYSSGGYNIRAEGDSFNYSTWLDTLKERSAMSMMSDGIKLVPIWELLPDNANARAKELEAYFITAATALNKDCLSLFEYHHISIPTTTPVTKLDNSNFKNYFTGTSNNGNYVLTSDIFLPSTWSPISKFQGTLDGAGYTIFAPSGHTFNPTSNFGLLAVSNSGTIKNLVVENVKISSTTRGLSLGAVCGINEGIISNVQVYNVKISDKCCVSSNDDRANLNIGGIAGINKDNAVIKLSRVRQGEITGAVDVNNHKYWGEISIGGLVGNNQGGQIYECHVTSVMFYSSSYANCNVSVIKHMFWDCEHDGIVNVGGLVGKNAIYASKTPVINTCIAENIGWDLDYGGVHSNVGWMKDYVKMHKSKLVSNGSSGLDNLYYVSLKDNKEADREYMGPTVQGKYTLMSAAESGQTMINLVKGETIDHSEDMRFWKLIKEGTLNHYVPIMDLSARYSLSATLNTTSGTQFQVGDMLTKDQVKVMFYDGATKKTVTDASKITYDFSSAGNKEVVFRYNYEGKDYYATLKVNVIEVQNSPPAPTYTYGTSGNGNVSTTNEMAGSSIKGSTASPATGYKFVRWMDLQGTTVSTNATFVPRISDYPTSATFIAYFEPVQYTLHYVVNGSIPPGFNVPEDRIDKAGSNIVLSSVTIPNGYSFSGWVTQDGMKKTSVALTTDITVVGTWSAAEYTITFDPNGGTLVGQNRTTYHYGDSMVLPTSCIPPTKPGYRYTFAYWEDNGQRITAITPTTFGNLHLSAIWNVERVTYNIQITFGEHISVSSPMLTLTAPDRLSGTVAYGSSVILRITADAGYDDNIQILDNGNHISSQGTITLSDIHSDHALSISTSANVYHIAYDLSGGTFKEEVPNNHTYGITTLLPASDTLTPYSKNGYVVTFTGWFRSGDATGTIQTEIPYDVHEDVLLIAKWQESRIMDKVSIICDTGLEVVDLTGIDSESSVPYGGNISFKIHILSGYVLDSVTLDDEILAPVDGVYLIENITTNIDIWCNAHPSTYHISYVLGGGSERTPLVTEYVFGIPLTLPVASQIQPYVKQGVTVTFDGWYLNGDSTMQTITEIPPGHMGEVVIVAKWRESVQSFNYEFSCRNAGYINLRGFEDGIQIGEIVAFDISKNPGYDQNITVTTNTGNLVREGDHVTISNVTDDLTITISCVANTYRIIFECNGGCVSSEYVSSYTYGEYHPLPNYSQVTPYTKNGVKVEFTGWYDVTDEAHNQTYGIAPGTLGDRTFGAIWTETVTGCYVKYFDTDSTTLISEEMRDYGSEITLKLSDKNVSPQKKLEFAGWISKTTGESITTITQNMDLVAKYILADRMYTARFIADEIIEYTLRYAEPIPLPEYKPIKTSDGEFDFEFAYWAGYSAGTVIENDVVFTPVYSAIAKTYLVIFESEGSKVKVGEYTAGSRVSAPLFEPTKQPSAQYTYSFTGWEGYDPDFIVSSDVTFKAIFKPALREYIITFISEGDVISTFEATFGTRIVLPDSSPVKPSDEFYEYSFMGWIGYSEGLQVSANHSFEAAYRITLKNIPCENNEVKLNSGKSESLSFSKENIDSIKSIVKSGIADKMIVVLDKGMIVLDGPSIESLASNDQNIMINKVDINTLSANMQNMVGNRPVYNIEFGNQHMFDGKLTVSLKYELKNDEDPDNLRIIYLQEDGGLEYIPCSYNEGYVTFETGHLSYYSIDNGAEKHDDGKKNMDSNIFILIAIALIVVVGITLMIKKGTSKKN